MPRQATSIDGLSRFLDLSVWGLAASGFLALAGSGFLDPLSVTVGVAGLAIRALAICGIEHARISERAAFIATLVCAAFFAADYFFLSREFLRASVHLLFLQATVRLAAADTGRGQLYVAAFAFMELLAGAVLSVNLNFFLFLALFLLFAVAALAAGELRRSVGQAQRVARAAAGFHGRLAALSIGITAGVLGGTAAIFFIAPRTADAAAALISQRLAIPRFNLVTLGDIGRIQASSRPVMHIRLFSRDLPGGLKWKGTTLAEFDGRQWSNALGSSERVPVQGGQAELSPPGSLPSWLPGVSYQVDYDGLATDILFLAGIPSKLYLQQGTAAAHATLLRGDGETYRLGRTAPPGFRYEGYSLLENPPETAPARYAPPVLPLAARERYLQLPTTLDRRIVTLARDFGGSGGDLERARSLERRLRSEFAYTLELPKREQADPLANFLFVRKKGHCEYFASAMAVMLRTIGIPSRLVTGFQSGVYNSLSDLWVVRASDAHSWVEAWIPGYGWATFDPTPANPGGYALVDRVNLYLDAAQTFWRQWIIGFDSRRQSSLADFAHQLGFGWTEGLTGKSPAKSETAAAWLKRRGGMAAGLITLALAILCCGPGLLTRWKIGRRLERARRGKGGVGDATLLYGRMLEVLKRRGYQKPGWFTPSEFARSLPRSPLGLTVEEFTDAYNALRFGGRQSEAVRMTALLDRLTQMPQ